MKMILAFLCLLSAAWAQDDAAIAKAKAGCGPEETRIDVKIAEHQHPMGQAESGKALVYVVGGEIDNGICCGITERVALDGSWVGGTHGNSYFFLEVAPGEHHMCANWQSHFASRKKRVSLAGFSAEAGKTYYFRVRVTSQGQHEPPLLDLEQINPDEG